MQIKHSRAKSGTKNIYDNGNICDNFLEVVCGPAPPRLVKLFRRCTWRIHHGLCSSNKLLYAMSYCIICIIDTCRKTLNHLQYLFLYYINTTTTTPTNRVRQVSKEWFLGNCWVSFLRLRQLPRYVTERKFDRIWKTLKSQLAVSLHALLIINFGFKIFNQKVFCTIKRWTWSRILG